MGGGYGIVRSEVAWRGDVQGAGEYVGANVVSRTGGALEPRTGCGKARALRWTFPAGAVALAVGSKCGRLLARALAQALAIDKATVGPGHGWAGQVTECGETLARRYPARTSVAKSALCTSTREGCECEDRETLSSRRVNETKCLLLGATALHI